MNRRQTIDNIDIQIISPQEITDVTVFCNSINDDWQRIWKHSEAIGCRPYNLVLISGLDWDATLTPWKADRVVSKRDNFAGHADQHLQWMIDNVLPLYETKYKVLAGYSLAGLFALWAPYVTDRFDAIASGSASVWFPGFEDFVMTHKMRKMPKTIYLSLGDKETQSRKPQLQQTENIMRRLADRYATMGIDSHFELNSGDHFTDYDLRLAKAIKCASNNL